MTDLEFIEETYKYYVEDPSRRGLNANKTNCVYINLATGDCCAIGRVLKEPKNIPNIEYEQILAKLSYERKEENYQIINDTLLKDKYKGINYELLVELQWWHDSPENWDKNGITDIGKSVINNLKEFYGKKR